MMMVMESGLVFCFSWVERYWIFPISTLRKYICTNYLVKEVTAFEKDKLTAFISQSFVKRYGLNMKVLRNL